jgi:hypothetical protein
VPETIDLVPASGAAIGSTLETQFVGAVEAAAGLAPDSPEREFLDNWRLAEGEWKHVFEQRIEDYFANLTRLARTKAGFDGWVRLAESRRREFRRRPLAEFQLTVPVTNIPSDAPALMMEARGTVHAMP